MTLSIPEITTQYGFTREGLGTHSSRTMMLEELRRLLASCPPTTDQETYRAAIEENNVLLKSTQSTRVKSFRHLRELYGLAPDILIFSALRTLWPETEEAQPMLAILCALARDPSLRTTAPAVLPVPHGSRVTSQALAEAAAQVYPGLSKETTLAKIGRNAGSSWTQSGHLAGRANKTRVPAPCHPTSVAYALLMGHLCGARGEGLFHTFWAQVLDRPVSVLEDLATAASKQGWLEYRHTGAITEITFDLLLQNSDKEPTR